MVPEESFDAAHDGTMSHATAPAAMVAAPRASRAHRAPGTARASSRPWRRAWAAPSRVARGRPQTPCAAERHAGDASTSAPAGALSIIDSTDDVFAEFCAAQVELVARALGRGARCMLYLRASGVDGENLQLTEVASYPPSPRWDGDATRADATRSFETAGLGADAPDDAFGAAASSFAESLGDGQTVRRGDGRSKRSSDDNTTSITLRGGGSVDEGDGGYGQNGQNGYGVTAAEALLVKQRVFALPSTNALVVPLSRDDQLLGLLVGEMPESGGWKGNSARTRKERERKKSERGFQIENTVETIPEVEVLSATNEVDETKEREAQDTAEKFGDRRKAALAAAARSVVCAWAMHRRADYATAAAIRSDERVEGFVTEAREPLTVLRTLGGMLSTHLKPESPSRDMAEAIVAQGDVLAALSSELESALYPRHIVDELAGAAGGKRALGALGAGGSRALPAPGAAPQKKGGPPSTTATSEALASGESPSCDVTPVVAGLLASAEVMAKPAGVTMTATFPEPPGGDGDAHSIISASARADPRDVRETLALVIDAALVAAPRGGSVDVVVSANGGSKGGVVVAVGVSAGDDPRASRASQLASLPAGALSAAAANAPPREKSLGDAFASETARAATATKKNNADRFTPPLVSQMEETQSLQIARSLVEGAGGIFHVLPSLPPAVGRVEMWWPAAEDARGDRKEEPAVDARAAEPEEDAVDVYSS